MEKTSNISDDYNSTLTLVNLLDEIDWIICGYGKPTPQFLYSFSTFVESYILTDAILVSLRDFFHLNLASPLFPDGRPILQMLIKDSLLKAIGEGPEHLEDDIGTVIYAFQLEKGKNISSDLNWFEEYKDKVDKKLLMEIIPSFHDIGIMPSSTPLLVLGGVDESKAICIFQRDVKKYLKSILNLSIGSHLHPSLPLYATKAQMNFYNRIPASIDLYRKIADVHKVNIEEILKHRGYSQLPIPPLVNILLSRCNNKEDIPIKLRELRSEFECLREASRNHIQRLEEAESLKEQLIIIEEFNEFWEVFNRKIKNPSTRIVYRFWNILKEANPLKCFTKTMDELIEWDHKRLIINRYKSLLDILALPRFAGH